MAYPSEGIEPGTRVVVTGATGFIGGRLTECLVALGADVKCLVRGSTVGDRLERSGARLHTIDIADARELSLALEDTEIVFHCAYDWNNESWNVAAIRALIEATRRAKCARLVYLSSFVVYAIPHSGEISEESGSDTSTSGYAHTKRDIESELLRAAATRNDPIPVSILQPTIVYGPYSKPWTIDPAMELLRGEVLLPGSGDGICNAVYVDDVVAAMLLAARHDGAKGKRFLISGPAPITWATFYDGMAKELGAAGPVYISTKDLKKERSLEQKILRLVKNPKRVVGKLVRIGAFRRVVALAKKARGRGAENTQHRVSAVRSTATKKGFVDMPNFGRLDFLEGRAIVSSAKAILEIGYSPRFTYDAGMAATGDFLRDLKARTT